MTGYVIPVNMQFVAEGHAEDERDMCFSDWDEWTCTRWQGHAGVHEAGVGNGLPVYAVWPAP